MRIAFSGELTLSFALVVEMYLDRVKHNTNLSDLHLIEFQEQASKQSLHLKFVTYSQQNSKLPYKTTLALINEASVTNGITAFDDIYGCILAIFILLADPKEQVTLLKNLQQLLIDNPLGAEVLHPLTKFMTMDYLSITNLGYDFPSRLSALARASIKNSAIPETHKHKLLNLSNI